MCACSMEISITAVVEETTVLSMASELVTFSAQARGIKFYDIPLPNVREGLKFRCEVERHNARYANSICLKCSPTCT